MTPRPVVPKARVSDTTGTPARPPVFLCIDAHPAITSLVARAFG